MDHALPCPAPPRATSPPVVIARPARQAAPLVFASAHSGRNYPESFVRAARLDAKGLRRSEDCFVDDLFGGVTALGVPFLTATFPRAYCDPNREAWELDPVMFVDELPSWVNTTSPRVGAGLGTLAKVVATGEGIYRSKLPFSEAEHRVEACWRPYHAALAGLVAETVAAFGCCLLVDCHSMPSHPSRGPAPDVVLGDVHGTSCAPSVTRLVEAELGGKGYQVRRNDPYAGGYVTRHYGRPRDGVHALQVEVARRLYMDERAIEPGDGFDALQRDLTDLAAVLVAQADDLLRQAADRR